MQGFSLNPTDADNMSRAAEEVIDAEVAYDPAFTPDQNFNTLVRTVRLLQVSLDLQIMRNDDLTEEINQLNTEAEVGAGGSWCYRKRLQSFNTALLHVWQRRGAGWGRGHVVSQGKDCMLEPGQWQRLGGAGCRCSGAGCTVNSGQRRGGGDQSQKDPVASMRLFTCALPSRALPAPDPG